jgi:regulator of sigma E protease
MITGIVFNIAIALLVLGVIIVIHELGHFLVAKFFKIKVETFSVGFGPRLLGFRYGDTDYRLSAFPLGGYVKMAGETPSDTITGEAYEFLSKPKWQRFLVAVAGPAMNVFLAVGLLAGLYYVGTDIPEFLSGQAVVGVIEPNSPAERIGIKAGDRIVSLAGKERPDWQDVFNTVLISPGATLPIAFEHAGQRIQATIVPERRGRDEAGYVGMGPLIRTVVRRVYGAPAQAAGIQVGDEIVKVNGMDLKTTGRTVQEIIQTIPEKTFPIIVLRDETAKNVKQPTPSQRKEIELQVTPVAENGVKRIGIEIPPPTIQVKLGLADAINRSIKTNTESAALIFQVIGRLFKRQASMRQLNGPIGIIQVSGQAFDAGAATLITLMALISLNLGVLNILPIPILDGGVMLLIVVEALIRRDLSLRMKERIVQVSFVFLLMLTVIVLYNDVVKLMPGQSAP